MALLQNISPSPQLSNLVRNYQVFRFVFEKDVNPPAKFHACRPEHSITFYLRDAQKVSYFDSDQVIVYPRCVINGIYTQPILRHGGHDFWAIKIVLQPTSLYHLIRNGINELTNKSINAEDVFGREINLTSEQLCESNDLKKMICIIENLLLRLLCKLPRDTQPFDEATSTLLTSPNCVNIERLAKASCLSKRQFIRKFDEQIGVGAKTYQRIARFDRAYRMKNAHVDMDWLSIALACGYHDYQHLSKDFIYFTRHTPPSFYEIENKSPERRFGLFER